MELDLVVKILLLGLIHWVLVPVALKYLVERTRVLGGRKTIWALPILLVTCLGPLSYLIVHELVPQPQGQFDLDYDR